MAELTAAILKSNDERRIVYGPVLVPNEPDSDGDVVTPEKIEEVAHKFMESYGNIDLQHTLNNVGKVIESYITPADLEINGYQIPKGSWMMGVKVTDDAAWQAVKAGKLTGFSIMGIKKAAIVEKSAEDITAAMKRTTLKDLGDDWVVNAVSLVDEPAVPKAKFLVIKSKEKTEDVTMWQRLKKLFAGDQKPAEDKGGEDMDKELIKEVVKSVAQELVAELKPALKQDEPQDQNNEPQSAQKADKPADQQDAVVADQVTSGEVKTDGDQPGEEVVTMSKAEYDQLIAKVEQLAEAVSKSKDFYSNRIIGQDLQASTKSSDDDVQFGVKRDAFGYPIR